MTESEMKVGMCVYLAISYTNVYMCTCTLQQHTRQKHTQSCTFALISDVLEFSFFTPDVHVLHQRAQRQKCVYVYPANLLLDCLKR